MKSRYWWLMLLPFCTLLTLLHHSGIVYYVISRKESLFAQLVDGLGLPSTLYMPDVSCRNCNSYDNRYLIEARAGIDCSYDHEIFLMILTVSSARNYERRKSIRQTWGSIGEHKGYSLRIYFVVGRSRNETVEVQLAKEAAYWGDIVQVDLADNYDNLTNKTIAAIKWAIGRCGSHFHYILKTDDDSFNVPQHFIDYLLTVGDSTQPFIGGLCASGEEPTRIPGHKWYVPVSAYPSSVYPLHCKGRAYVLSSAAALLISSVSRQVLFSTMEDVYVTGVCRSIAGIQCSCIPGIPRHPEEFTECSVATGKLLNTHYIMSPDKMASLWSLANNKTVRESCAQPVTKTRYIILIAVCLLIIVTLSTVAYCRTFKHLNYHIVPKWKVSYA